MHLSGKCAMPCGEIQILSGAGTAPLSVSSAMPRILPGLAAGQGGIAGSVVPVAGRVRAGTGLC
ncbi:hypothetical protein SCA03_45400 [Streptomyces cacaoi]|uniref:Uncharacterized protein n=1 Tax=Streptomyces cacaoi TaxID=1898 RepID=A0A4Y3R3T8_STRCI|nr:hypothetical protein SCA03_45400 [Streptomyces cacaoi]